MHRYMKFICFFLALVWGGCVFANTLETENDLEETDIQALREWIYTKRQVTVSEKGGALSISGEVRAEFQLTNETRNGIKQRGLGSATGIPARTYDVEVNLMMDYRTDRTWASLKLEFDNDAGVFSGSLNKIKLERAFIGVRLRDTGIYTVDAVIGRNSMSAFFDSKIEFGNFFDGILLKYDHNFEKIGDFYLHPAVFIIDEKKDHYGYIVELGMLDIADLGFYAKYSLIDWNTKHYKKPKDNRRFDFLVSQVILGYKCIPEALKKPATFYMAGLCNHNAHKLQLTDQKRANLGGYIGVSMGELKKKGDWAFDGNYQLVAAQAIPDFDNAGIGLGNANKSGLYRTNVDGTGESTTRKNAGGNNNFRGFSLSFQYLLTNNLNVFQQWQQSMTLDASIGPFRRYKQYEIEFIYLF